MAQTAAAAKQAARYWVVGGVYKDTRFADAERGEERHGPFESYKDAYDAWARLAWRSVDDCHARYRIEQD